MSEDPHSSSPARLSRRAIAFGLGYLALAIGAGLILISLQPSPGTASLSPVEGAAALPKQKVPQETARTLRPSPQDAGADRSRIVSDGCMVGIEGTRSSRCLYGDHHGGWTLVLYGDSHAMQYFPPLQALARKHHWRLIVLNKRECTPGEVGIRGESGSEYSTCDAWHRTEMRRITGLGRRTTVVISGDSAYTAYGSNGHALRGRANADAMEAGYLATLRKIHRAGLGAIVIRDMPAAPRDIPNCVAKNRDHLRACAFRWVHNANREFDVRAARAAPGSHLIDLTPEVCPDDLCRAVIGNALVYRDKQHLSATFARTLSPWIATGLREAGVPSGGHSGR
jgi:hypothetical protein